VAPLWIVRASAIAAPAVKTPSTNASGMDFFILSSLSLAFLLLPERSLYVMLNQLLILSHEAGMSRGFFEFYFQHDAHLDGGSWYDPKKLPEFEPRFLTSTGRRSAGRQTV
jgi:hypothetical protein